MAEDLMGNLLRATCCPGDPRMVRETHYEVLEIEMAADLDTITRSYRRLMLAVYGLI